MRWLVHRIVVPLIGVSRSGSGVGYSQLQGEYRCSTLVPIEPQRLLFVDSRILPQPDDQEPRSVNTTIKFCDKCVPLCYNWTPSRTVYTQLSILDRPQLIRSLNRANTREMLSAGKRGGCIGKERNRTFFPPAKIRVGTAKEVTVFFTKF